jgi:hypothetical protein
MITDTNTLRVLREINKSLTLICRRQGIGNRLRAKFSAYGMGSGQPSGGGGCGGCGKTAEKLNTMSTAEAEAAVDQLLAEMDVNVEETRDTMVKVLRTMTTEKFRHDFSRKRLLACITEQNEEDEMIGVHLRSALVHDDVPEPVVQFVNYLLESIGDGDG